MVRVNRLAVALMLLLSAAVSAPALGAQQSLEQPTYKTDAPHTCRAGMACAQTFVPTVGGVVVREVWLPLARQGTTDFLLVEVRNVVGGMPGDVVLARGVLDPAQVPPYTEGAYTDPGFTRVQLSQVTDQPLEAGTEYALVVSSQPSGASVVTAAQSVQPTFYWYDQKEGGYAGGRILLESTSGGLWQAYDQMDFAFRILMDEAPAAPEFKEIDDQTVAEGGTITLTLPIDDPQGLIKDVTASTSRPDLLGTAVAKAGGTWALTLTASDVVRADSDVQVTVTAEYADGSTMVRTFTTTVTNINDAPQIYGLEQLNGMKVQEDKTATFRFRVYDEESAETDLQVTVTADKFADGTVQVDDLGQVEASFQLQKNVFGTTLVTVTVSDGELQAAGTFTLEIEPVNDPPVFVEVPESAQTDEDVPTEIKVVAYDPDGLDVLRLEAVSSYPALLPSTPDNGGYGIKIEKIGYDPATGQTEWKLTLNPRPDQSGTTTVTLYVNDGQYSAMKSFQLRVAAVNDRPEIKQVERVVRRLNQGTFSVDLEVTDQETNVPSLTVDAYVLEDTTQVLGPVEARLAGAKWQVWVTPMADKTGTATIRVTVDDNSKAPNSSATMDFQVVIERDPVITGLPPSAQMVEEEEKEFTFTVESASKVEAVSSAPDQVKVVLTPSGSGWKVTVTPEKDVVGSFVVTVTASNEYFATTHNMTISVTNVNDPPEIAELPPEVTTDEDVPVTVDLIIRDPDPNDSHQVIVEVVSLDQPQVANVQAFGQGLHRTLRITPFANMVGETVYRITVRDRAGLEASKLLTVKVLNVDDPPIIFVPDLPVIDEDTPSATFVIRVSDPDTPGPYQLSASSTDVPISWGLQDPVQGVWELVIWPYENQAGDVYIHLVATSGGLTTQQVFKVHIREINDPPSLFFKPAAETTYEDTPLTLEMTIADPETPLDKLRVTVSSDNPTLLPSSSFNYSLTDGKPLLRITPAPDQHGKAMITVTVSDGFLTAQRTLELTVLPVDDPPRLTGVGDSIVIDEDAQFEQQVQVYDPDVPGGPVSVDISYSGDIFGCETGTSCEPVRLTGSGQNRRLIIVPKPDTTGDGQITFRLWVRDSDDKVREATRTISVSVLPVNDPPYIRPIPDQQILEGEVLSGLQLLLGDIDSDVNKLKVEASSSDQYILKSQLIRIEPEFATDNGLGVRLSAVPEEDRFGTVTITVKVTDDRGASASEKFKLTIRPVNDPPSFTAGAPVVVDEDAGPQTIRNWARNISPGPYEQGQKLTFEVEVPEEARSLFAAGPAISADGTLTFTTAQDRYGEVTLQVRLRDDGGTENGGVDVSDPQALIIRVNPVNDRPVIEPIADQGTDVGTPTDEIDLLVSDVETPTERLEIWATSSNTSLVPNENITVVQGAAPTIRLKPAEGKTGTATITVYAKDEEGLVGSRSFDLIVNNLSLKGLEPSVGTLSPTFDPRILTYMVPYSGWVPQVRVTAYVQDPTVRIRVEGQDVASGVASQPVRLGENGGQVRVEVYSPVTGVSKPYTLYFVRSQSTVAQLADLSITPGELQPKFDPDRYQYTATVPYEVTAVTVNARPGDAWTKVTIEGNDNLKVGTNRIVVTVTAESGDRKQYIITVTRQAGPLRIEEVKVETGAEWATLKLALDDNASVTVYYRPENGEERSRSAGYGRSHTITLTGLQPATSYTYRVQADRSGGTGAELVSAFRTAAPEAKSPCTISADGSLTCPATSTAVSRAGQVLPNADPGEIAVTAVTDRDMAAALAEILADEAPEGERLVTLRLADLPNGVALLDEAALRRAAGSGVAVRVESPRGSVTLTPALLADLKLAEGEQLAVALTAGEIDPRDLEPWLGVGGYRQVGEPLSVSLVRLSDRGTAAVSTLPTPLVVSHPVEADDEVEAATMAVFGRVAGSYRLEPLGGRLTADGSSIEAEQALPGSTVVLAFESRFSDVPASHWAYRTVHEMAARQVLRGVSTSSFAPEQPITRGQLAAILTRALGLGEDDRFARIYYDVSPYDALAGEIGGAIRAGVMSGYPDGTFRPDVPVTRQELAVVLSRMADILNLSGSLNREAMERLAMMADWGDVATWAQDGVRFAVSEGLMQGRSATAFSPLGQTTRAEAATVIKRLLDKVAPGEWR